MLGDVMNEALAELDAKRRREIEHLCLQVLARDGFAQRYCRERFSLLHADPPEITLEPSSHGGQRLVSREDPPTVVINDLPWGARLRLAWRLLLWRSG